jgi:hypothetical protein
MLADIASVSAHLLIVARRAGATEEEAVAVILPRRGASASAETLEDTIGGGLAIGLGHGIDASEG